jgi:hypothetical protein
MVCVVFGLPFVIVALLIGVAAMTAIWHPDLERRRAAFRVLDRLLQVFPTGRKAERRDRHDRGG